MSLTVTQEITLALLRSHRSRRSWVAGSTVLHHLLPRSPGDLDLHHPDARAAWEAVRADLATLLDHGFALAGSGWLETERWARFRHEKGPVVLNWVVAAASEHPTPRRHPSFGYAIGVSDAIAEKVNAAREFGRRKDLDDLAAVLRAGARLPDDLRRSVQAVVAARQGADVPAQLRRTRP
ncbi:hypothetical protein [Inquilinus sp. Marseille-Q2685]|uniref:hypothetical protein n=1 Tax=Inquilinus sp. Marseille-Q2685 TaxID=2866581 RepID=UPI001CE4392D|nr:hypothetical protein [Inquilinus sp. Marseille-Q2685]